MGDDWSRRHCEMGTRFREDDGFGLKGYDYVQKQNQTCKSSPKLEENRFGSYLKQNQQTKPNLNQTKVIMGKEMLKKLENRRSSSPSVIAKLMGINEIPPQEGLYSNSKITGGSFRKIPEFKDVFEVIEERKKRRNGKGQIRKKFIQDEKFEDNFESYKDRFVKNLEKTNPLFAKHLIDLKSSPPHFHKYPNLTENPKMRNLGQMGNFNYNHHDNIVVLDPKFVDFNQSPSPNLERNIQRNFSDNFETRRVKNENYRVNFEKLRKLESSFGIYEKEPKTLAEMLALSDSENFNARNYNKKIGKVRSARDINYEKEEGSFANLPQYLSSSKSSLYERDDVARLRARNKKLKENLIFGRNFSSSSRFREEDISARKHDLRGFSENNLEMEEKMLFTIDEAQKERLRSNFEEKEGRFAKYCERIKKLKQAEQPSPVSVLEPASTEEETSSSCFLKDEMDTSSSSILMAEQDASSSILAKEDFTLHDSDTQVNEEHDTYLSSEEENEIETNNESTLNLLRDQEEREFSYLLDMLISSGVYGPHADTLRKACYSRTSPVNSVFFDRLERKYGQVSTWSKSERRLFFDCANSVLARVLESCLDPHPWVRVESKVGPVWGNEGLVEKVWLVLRKERERERRRENEDDDVADDDWDKDFGDDLNVIGKRIERMLTDEMLEETVFGFLSD